MDKKYDYTSQKSVYPAFFYLEPVSYTHLTLPTIA